MGTTEVAIDDKLLRKINRQLRAIKLMLGFFTLVVFGLIAILGFLTWQVLSFTRNVEHKINTIQTTTEQKLDIQAQLCKNANQNALTEQFCN